MAGMKVARARNAGKLLLCHKKIAQIRLEESSGHEIKANRRAKAAKPWNRSDRSAAKLAAMFVAAAPARTVSRSSEKDQAYTRRWVDDAGPWCRCAVLCLMLYGLLLPTTDCREHVLQLKNSRSEW